MTKKIIQTSCSELLVDTEITDANEAYKQFSSMFKELGWESSPPLSVKVMRDVMEYSKHRGDDSGKFEDPNIMIYDKNGNRAWLEYGYNGYITTGFRFDSHCNHVDSNCFPIFREAIKRLGGELVCCDGGSTGSYEEWYKNWESKAGRS